MMTAMDIETQTAQSHTQARVQRMQQQQQQQVRTCTWLNNVATDSMKSGDIDLAISSLRECITTVRDALTPRFQGIVNDNNSCGLRVETEHQNVMQEENEGSSYLQSWITYENTNVKHQLDVALEASLDNRGIYISTNPIIIPHDVSETVPCVTPVHALVSMFNMALCYHMKATQEQQDEDLLMDSISKAINLYKLCDDLIRTSGIRASLVFCMTITNNLGSLYSMLGSKDQSISCFERLLSTQMLLMDRNHSAATFDGFWYNTSRLVLSQSTSPAA